MRRIVSLVLLLSVALAACAPVDNQDPQSAKNHSGLDFGSIGGGGAGGGGGY